jgi:hypothetical protein
MPKDGADNEIGIVPLASEIKGLGLRRLVVQPGGVVPWRSHGDRPVEIYTASYTVACAGKIAPWETQK